VDIHDSLLAAMPEGARHDPAICVFCIKRATHSPASVSPVTGGLDASESQHEQTKGGTPETMSTDTLTKETHEALLERAISQATATTESALERKTTEAADLASKVELLEEDNTTLKADNERLNKELDAAQVSLKAAEEKVTTLESTIADKDAAAEKAQVQSKRTEQVRNLDLFAAEYVAEKASSWAELTEEAWKDRMEEWQRLKPATDPPKDPTKTETATVMTGTSGDLTKEPESDAANHDKPTPRRAVLGLTT
jgi:regulator of replication initiation timing